MHEARASHSATLLANGKVLVVGGTTPTGVSQTAELFDSQTGTWRYTRGTLSVPRAGHRAVQLADGSVLIVGGGSDQPGSRLSSADIFNPSDETFTPTSSMNTQAGNISAFRLADGRVLVVGRSNNPNSNESVEIFNPTTKTWTTKAALPPGGLEPAAVMLADGRILIAGGSSGTSNVAVYTPATNAWQVMAPLLQGRENHTAVALASGKVWIVSGTTSPNGFPGVVRINSTELYDANVLPNGATTLGPDLGNRNYPTPAGLGHQSTMLSNGNVLVTGGAWSPTYNAAVVPTSAAVLYDYTLNDLVPIGTMAQARLFHSATALPSGQVLVTGGMIDGFGSPTAAAELWGSPQVQAGTISVTTNLPAATFTISGPATYTGSGTLFSQKNVPPGTYTITYGAVTGYQTPAAETKTVTSGESISFDATYENVVGAITVSVQPYSATYNITGPAGFTGLGMSTYNAMPAGQYTILFMQISGYATPPPQTQRLSAGLTITFTATYQLLPGTGSLRVQVSPNTATYNISGPSGFSGVGSSTYSGLPVGTYTVTFSPLVGSSTPKTQTILLHANDTVSVSGKYLSSVSPPTLKIVAGAICDQKIHPICVSTKIMDRGPTFITADVTISNVTGAWYELDVQFYGPTTSAPEPITIDTANIPTNFIIGPLRSVSFPGVRFQAGQYFAIDANKYSVAATGMLAIDMITRGLFGVEFDTSWNGRLDLISGEMQALLTTVEVGAPAVAFSLCKDNLCRIQQLGDFVSKAAKSDKVWTAVQSVVGEVFGTNAVRHWLDIGGKSVAELLSVFTGIPKLVVLMDQTFASANVGGFRIEAVQ